MEAQKSPLLTVATLVLSLARHCQTHTPCLAARFGRKFEAQGSCVGPGSKVDAPELSSGPEWKIEEVSRVGAQRVTSKSKLLAREMPRLCSTGLRDARPRGAEIAQGRACAVRLQVGALLASDGSSSAGRTSGAVICLLHYHYYHLGCCAKCAGQGTTRTAWHLTPFVSRSNGRATALAEPRPRRPQPAPISLKPASHQ